MHAQVLKKPNHLCCGILGQRLIQKHSQQLKYLVIYYCSFDTFFFSVFLAFTLMFLGCLSAAQPHSPIFFLCCCLVVLFYDTIYSRRLGYYSILNPFGQKSQYISINVSLDVLLTDTCSCLQLYGTYTQIENLLRNGSYSDCFGM